MLFGSAGWIFKNMNIFATCEVNIDCLFLTLWLSNPSMRVQSQITRFWVVSINIFLILMTTMDHTPHCLYWIPKFAWVIPQKNCESISSSVGWVPIFRLLNRHSQQLYPFVCCPCWSLFVDIPPIPLCLDPHKPLTSPHLPKFPSWVSQVAFQSSKNHKNHWTSHQITIFPRQMCHWCQPMVTSTAATDQECCSTWAVLRAVAWPHMARRSQLDGLPSGNFRIN